MTWWGEGFGEKSRDPTRKFQFLIEMGNGGYMLSAKSVSKPKVNIEPKEYRMINHYYSYPGIAKWDPITITLVDIGNFVQTLRDDKRTASTGDDGLILSYPSTSNALWEMLLSSGYSTPGGSAGSSQRAKSISSPEKASTIANSFGNHLYIYQLDADAKVIEWWDLRNPIITKISWGDLDYGDDGLVEYTLDVKYDWAELLDGKDLKLTGRRLVNNNVPPAGPNSQ
jgi:hypothetical protein